MNKMKGLVYLAAMAMLLAGCSSGQTSSPLKAGQSDAEYIKEKGTLIVGITDYAPMDFKDGEKWTGYDARLSEAFADMLGVKAEFVEIDWDKKTELLQNGEIDCIWNGMTKTDELLSEIDCSDPYLLNGQVVVMSADNVDKYTDIEQCQHLLFSAENGSTGEDMIKQLKYRYTPCGNMKETLQSLSDGKADAAVVDIIMAGYYTSGEGEFSNLGYKIRLNDEEMCIGLRKGSDLTEKVNDFLKEKTDDGTCSALAKEYGITDALIGAGK